MAKASGTTRNKRDGGLKPNDGNYKGKIGRPQSLKTIKNKAVYANPNGVFSWDRYSGEEALQVLLE